MANKEYWIMDGRARFDTDRAVVCEICNSFGEAMRRLDNYGDAVVVDPRTDEVVYDPHKKGA